MLETGVLALLLAAAAEDPWADFTELVFHAEVPNGSIITVEKDEVRVDKRGRKITIWMRTDGRAAQGLSYRTSISRQTYFCDGYFTTTAYTTYKDDGAVEDSWDEPLAPKQAIRPDTIAAAIESKLCGGDPFL